VFSPSPNDDKAIKSARLILSNYLQNIAGHVQIKGTPNSAPYTSLKPAFVCKQLLITLHFL
jgi:hypothetical protein